MTRPSSPQRRSPKPKRAPELNGAAFRTVFGWAGAAASRKGVRLLILPGGSRKQVEARLKRLGARVHPAPPPSLRPVARAVEDYFEGKPARLDFPLDLSELSPFAKRVMSAARKIGRGHVRTYAQVAAAAGSPGAARAVGGVMARNPFPLAVP